MLKLIQNFIKYVIKLSVVNSLIIGLCFNIALHRRIWIFIDLVEDWFKKTYAKPIRCTVKLGWWTMLLLQSRPERLRRMHWNALYFSRQPFRRDSSNPKRTKPFQIKLWGYSTKWKLYAWLGSLKGSRKSVKSHFYRQYWIATGHSKSIENWFSEQTKNDFNGLSLRVTNYCCLSTKKQLIYAPLNFF